MVKHSPFSIPRIISSLSTNPLQSDVCRGKQVNYPILSLPFKIVYISRLVIARARLGLSSLQTHLSRAPRDDPIRDRLFLWAPFRVPRMMVHLHHEAVKAWPCSANGMKRSSRQSTSIGM